ncbi:unnamed protein product [Phyllotreta striolata]|uniref:CAP N-terminal domain-containing protein n=1 Tax=Phyllotreta striolata TaxID=444603 RepID=A0A9N9TV04_PHYSR|nr:unnamed protein product [Phyllotreta striolata]
MNVSDCLREIYVGPFSDYLTASNSLGGLVKDQSQLVNCLFKLEINLMQILQKYKKPVHSQEEDIFLEPISKQINIIKNHAIEKSADCHYLQFVSDSIEIYCWTKETDLETFISRFSDLIIAYKSKYRFSNIAEKYSGWLEAWTQTLEELSEFVLTHFKNGLVWQGNEILPAQAALGDKNEFRNFDHKALFKDINRANSRLLRQADENADNPE